MDELNGNIPYNYEVTEEDDFDQDGYDEWEYQQTLKKQGIN
ncbi:hypothetical protein Q5O89_16755 [Peribacillus frigoritolerans]|nr:hypothetical protein [Peribacillus frigoritolerans]